MQIKFKKRKQKREDEKIKKIYRLVSITGWSL